MDTETVTMILLTSLSATVITITVQKYSQADCSTGLVSQNACGYNLLMESGTTAPYEKDFFLTTYLQMILTLDMDTEIVTMVLWTSPSTTAMTITVKKYSQTDCLMGMISQNTRRYNFSKEDSNIAPFE